MRQFKEKRVSFLQVLTRLLCPEAQLSLHTKGGENTLPPPPLNFVAHTHQSCSAESPGTEIHPHNSHTSVAQRLEAQRSRHSEHSPTHLSCFSV